MRSQTHLPIQAIVPQLLSFIEHNDCILSAPPGAGKSTYLPLALLSQPFFADKTILLLQPRQVAVRAIANFLASSLQEPIGQTIGYQMRGESVLSKQTRLCVITEGLLVAKLQSDPELRGVGLIIFDEFHERSVFSDVALGLSLEVASVLREDLRLLVMSATLNIAQLSKLMPKAKQLSSSGRAFPIDYLYRPLAPARTSSHKNLRLINHIVNTITEAFNYYDGNILVFLSGADIIKKTKNALDALSMPKVLIAPLFGALSPQKQTLAIDNPPQGIRKIVLATNIAETSLTINDVNIVIDSGLEKVQSFVVSRKLNQLSEQMISKASSIQRAGRAGRQREGVCYRLWSQEQQQFLQENAPPQITQQDISQTMLTLIEWGSSFSQLPLIDKPSTAQIDYSKALLVKLGMLNAQHNITSIGKTACQFNTHPRMARILVAALMSASLSQKLLSAILVSVIEGKSITQLSGSSEIIVQCRFVIALLKSSAPQKGAIEYRKDVTRIARQLVLDKPSLAALGTLPTHDDLALMIADLLLLAFPDKLARKRTSHGYTAADGTGVEFTQNYDVGHSPLHATNLFDASPQWIVCTQTQLTHKTNGIIRQYCEIPAPCLNRYLNQFSQKTKQQQWDTSLEKIVCKQVVNIGAIEISSQVCAFIANDETIALLLAQIRYKGLETLLAKANTLLARLQLLQYVDGNSQIDEARTHGIIQNPTPDIEKELGALDVSLKGLTDTMETWLRPYLVNLVSWQQLRELNYNAILSTIFTYSQAQYLAAYYPTHFTAPTGNKHLLDYSEPEKVTLSIRIQELYGLVIHPSVGKAKLPVTLSLLSPAHREIQKTADLPNFWIGSYKMVQKEMKGRYPRHFWPDNPHKALPTTKTKKKM